jgi:hypothetical protein
MYSDLGVTADERPLKLAIASAAVGRQIESTKLLTRREGLQLVRTLNDLNQELATFGVNPDGSVTIYQTREDDQR